MKSIGLLAVLTGSITGILLYTMMIAVINILVYIHNIFY